MDAVSLTRPDLIRRGQRLEYFTVAYNSLEGLVSIIAGVMAGSVSLIGFGLDSVIEVASGTALLWRLRHDFDPSRREQVERTTLRLVGWCFIALALYTYLSAILLGGLLLNAVLGWWWADPVAGLAMAPIIAKEGLAGLRGKTCCDECGCH